jgi:hypothetical protein
MKILLIGLLAAVASFSSFAADDTSVVDLSDKTSDTVYSPSLENTTSTTQTPASSDTVYSPSLENTTPAGQAPGGPIESK